MNVFLSYSGDRSFQMAEVLYHWLPKFLPEITPFLSNHDIKKGAVWFNSIQSTAESSQIGILCVTPENFESPWLMYEMGLLTQSVGQGNVFPILLGISDKDLTGPLGLIQCISLNRDNLLRLLKQISSTVFNTDYSPKFFDNYYENFLSDLENVSQVCIQDRNLSIKNIIHVLLTHGISKPNIGNEMYFKSGFESHALYSSATSSAKKRLWIFGRKNRKLFDKEYHDFFYNIKQKIDDGFDLRILFLDKNTDQSIINQSHRDNKFYDELCASIENAIGFLNSLDINMNNICRSYSFKRDIGMIIIDDAICYTPITTENNQVKSLTKSSFIINNSNSAYGQELIRIFENAWKNSRVLIN